MSVQARAWWVCLMTHHSGRSQSTCLGTCSMTTLVRSQSTCTGLFSMHFPSETSIMTEVVKSPGSMLHDHSWGSLTICLIKWVCPMRHHSQLKSDNLPGYVLDYHSQGSETTCLGTCSMTTLGQTTCFLKRVVVLERGLLYIHLLLNCDNEYRDIYNSVDFLALNGVVVVQRGDYSISMAILRDFKQLAWVLVWWPLLRMLENLLRYMLNESPLSAEVRQLA